MQSAVRGCAIIYATVVRGYPRGGAAADLLFCYHAVRSAASASVSPWASCAFGINSGAYMAEMHSRRNYRRRLRDRRKRAEVAWHLTEWRPCVFVVLPQAIKNILPAIGNEMIALAEGNRSGRLCGRAGSDSRRQT